MPLDFSGKLLVLASPFPDVPRQLSTGVISNLIASLCDPNLRKKVRRGGGSGNCTYFLFSYLVFCCGLLAILTEPLLSGQYLRKFSMLVESTWPGPCDSSCPIVFSFCVRRKGPGYLPFTSTQPTPGNNRDVFGVLDLYFFSFSLNFWVFIP